MLNLVTYDGQGSCATREGAFDVAVGQGPSVDGYVDCTSIDPSLGSTRAHARASGAAGTTLESENILRKWISVLRFFSCHLSHRVVVTVTPEEAAKEVLRLYRFCLAPPASKHQVPRNRRCLDRSPSLSPVPR